MEIIYRKCINIEVPNNICMPEKVRNRTKTALILLLVAIVLSSGGLVGNPVSNTGYFFTDTAVNEYDENQRVATVTTVEASPTMFDSTRGDLTGYKKITWTRSDSPNFDHYEIYMSSEPDFKANDTNLISIIPDRETTSVQVESLIPNKTYYVKLLHIDDKGEVLKIESGSILTDSGSILTDDGIGKEEKEEDSFLPGFSIFGVFTCVLIIVLVLGGRLPGLRPRN